MNTYRMLAVAGIVVALSGCDRALTAPRPFMGITAQGLQYTTSISKSVIERGDTATFHYTLRNVSGREVVLGFSSGCQLLPYIMREREMVLPRGGGWGCTMALTTLRLAPGQAIDRTQILFAGQVIPANLTWVPLEPGDYVGYAELGLPDLENFGRSTSANFRVN